MEYLFVIKFAFVVSFVLFLSILTDRVGPKYSGFISGLPTGTAITLFFIGLEISPAFAAQSAIFNLAGMTAMQAFVYLYFRASNSIKKYTVALSSLVAAAGYFITIFLLHAANLTEIAAILVPVATTPIFMLAMKSTPEADVKKPVRLSNAVLLFRAVVAASVILFVIWLAPAVGPEFAGLLSAFPTTLFPLMLIVHTTYGTGVNSALVKNVSKSHFSMLFFSLTIFYAFPVAGVYLGTLLAYAAAGAYLALFYAISVSIRKKG